jgi:WD40 repeat protein
VLFAPQGDRVAVGAPGVLRIVDLQGQSRERQANVERPWTNKAAFSRDGARLAIADHDGAVSVLDGKTATELARIEQSDGPITTIAFSPDIRLVATGTDRGEMALWSVVDGRLLLGLVPHGREVTTLQFSPDGARLASASWDSTVKIHHVATGTLEQHLQSTSSGPVDNVLFLPDSRRALTQSRRAFVHMWDVLTGEALTRFDLRGSGLFNMAISPNGRFLAVATWDGQVQLWNLDTGVELADAQGEWTSVSKVAFSDSSDHLVVVADAKKLFVWGLSVELRGLGYGDEVERAVVTAAALSNGVGVLLDHEREDFLFRDAPRDLYASLCAMLTDEQRAKIEPMARLLREERAPDAYRPPFHATIRREGIR